MPRNEYLVLCGGLDRPPKASKSTVCLNLHSASPNVRLRITDISRRLLTNIPDVLADLLEIASYVYAADAAISRGGKIDVRMGARWRRRFRFLISVRQPDHWSSDPVLSALCETLSFLSEDDYEFEFRPVQSPPPVESYFEFPDTDGMAFTPDEVILFSGGLDSFAGTVQQLAEHGKAVALVSHRSASKIAGAQKHLVDELRNRFGPNRVLHIPVWANLDASFTKETTHRVRSFLFAALGAVTARLFNKTRISFFENGVVSLNLPLVGQVVGARATRTTHPQALAGFRRVLAAVLNQSLAIDNPFAWLTKAEVIERISANDCGDLIRHTRSCTRVHAMTTLHPHCGQCSQCIDRRFAVLATGQSDADPSEAYAVDLFTGERPAGPDREMALAYVRSASDIHQMVDVAFFARHGETSRIVGFFPETADTIAGHIFDLYRRHAADVCRIFDQAIADHRSALREGSLPANCLLTLVIGRHDLTSAYPALRGEPEEVVADRPAIRISIDEEHTRVLFDRWGEITGVGAKLLIALASPFREAIRDELPPERYPFTSAPILGRQIKCPNEETLRRRVFRCRNSITRLAANAGDRPPSIEDVIESSQWRGYRLNPDGVRIVTRSDVRATPQPIGSDASLRRPRRDRNKRSASAS
jgi:7-cyano-7-deazaguanine synthase in queuosine biosynthesis